ncbi:hypothetical protein [Rheinheimera hassiensis]|uniref:hypothetical protein n=1 Tax=Rheinheimera hassiensis TaxID=1193627 RepID=UPI001F052FBE|nr:hypothetical protein [Rheinheimera hassiensis]
MKTVIFTLVISSLSFGALSCEEGKQSFEKTIELESKYKASEVNPILFKSSGCFLSYRSKIETVDQQVFLSFMNDGAKKIGGFPPEQREQATVEFINELTEEIPVYFAYNPSIHNKNDIVIGIYTETASSVKGVTSRNGFTEYNLTDNIKINGK